MSAFLTSVYTGPVNVKEIAQKFREADIAVYLEGTEHIYIDVTDEAASSAFKDEAADKLKAKLKAKHGTSFGLDFPMIEWGVHR